MPQRQVTSANATGTRADGMKPDENSNGASAKTRVLFGFDGKSAERPVRRHSEGIVHLNRDVQLQIVVESEGGDDARRRDAASEVEFTPHDAAARLVDEEV